jgi:hypothetical protein
VGTGTNLAGLEVHCNIEVKFSKEGRRAVVFVEVEEVAVAHNDS